MDKSRKGAASASIMRRRCWWVGCSLSPILQKTKVGCSEVSNNVTLRYSRHSCGCNSVGRVIAFQAIGRRFEPDHPLHFTLGVTRTRMTVSPVQCGTSERVLFKRVVAERPIATSWNDVCRSATAARGFDSHRLGRIIFRRAGGVA